jgi:hypothetical protein
MPGRYGFNIRRHAIAHARNRQGGRRVVAPLRAADDAIPRPHGEQDFGKRREKGNDTL